MTPRATASLALAIVVAAGLFLLIGWQRASAEKRNLADWLSDSNLPQDLPEYVGQLESLAIPGRLDALDLSEFELLDLSVGRLETADLRNLPRELQSLEVREWATLESFEDLPSSLTGLKVAAEPSRHLGALPASLREIELSGVEELELGALPVSVWRVTLAGTEIPNLYDLPARALDLSFRGRGIESLDGIRRSVFSVSLRNTAVSSLEPLPASLHSLELEGNGRLGPITTEDLPEHLVELSIRGGDLTQLNRLPNSLRRLQLRGTNAGAKILDRLPATLAELDLDRPRDSNLCSLPSSLKVLWLSSAETIEPDCLPRDLEDVSFKEMSPGVLRRLDRPLRALSVHGAVGMRIGDLSKLLTTLERLDLGRNESTDLTTLAGAANLQILILQHPNIQVLPRLPASLKVLNLAGSGKLDSLGSLGETSPDLRELDISYTKLASLDGVPSGLQGLRIEGSRVHDLTGLPAGLVHLTLATRQVESLAGLPKSVRYLTFVKVQE